MSDSKDKMKKTERRRYSSKKLTAMDFYVGTVLGEGAFSKVLHVKQKSERDEIEGKEYAVKIVEKNFVTKHKKTAVVMMERNVLMRLNHPNVVKLHFTFRNKRFLFFGLDLCERGNLLNVITHRRKEKEDANMKDSALDMEDLRFYGLEMLAVLEYIHSEGIIHRDLKPENILIKNDRHLMLADFGTAKDERSKKRCNTFCGTAEYVSPEVLRDEEATCAADYWAAGCILYQMYHGHPPFRGLNDMATFELITTHDASNRQFQYPSNSPKCLRSALDSIFVQDPKRRLGGKALRSHPLFLQNTATTTSSSSLTTMMCLQRVLNCSSILREVSIQKHILSFILTRDVEREILKAEAPALPKMMISRTLAKITPESGLLEKFELVLARREMREVYEDSNMIENLMEDDEVEKTEEENHVDSTPGLRPKSEHIDSWQKHLDENETIILSGLVVKKRYRFVEISSKHRHLLLTDKPRLMYLNPETSEKRGEIPWSDDMAVDLKMDVPGGFDIKTPHRTYYLRDMLGDAKRWKDAIYKALGRKDSVSSPHSPRGSTSETASSSSSLFNWW